MKVIGEYKDILIVAMSRAQVHAVHMLAELRDDLTPEKPIVLHAEPVMPKKVVKCGPVKGGTITKVRTDRTTDGFTKVSVSGTTKQPAPVITERGSLRACVQCGKTFARKTSEKTCSQQCRDARLRGQKAEWARAERAPAPEIDKAARLQELREAGKRLGMIGTVAP